MSDLWGRPVQYGCRRKNHGLEEGNQLAKKFAKKPRKSSGRMASKGFPNPVDIHVGRQIRMRRTLLGMSQSVLADSVGLTFQQIQKYEKGANRVGSSRLFDFSRVLGVPISFFYEGMTSETASQSPANLMGISQNDLPEIDDTSDPLARRETLEFVRAYYRISDEPVRQQLAKLIKSLSKP
jgi:transcriptional regulator with XRE-family HTH domain